MLRNKLRYLLLIASTGLLLILYNKYYIGIIFLTILVMPFLLFGHLSYCYGNIKAELVSTTHVANKGDRIPITIMLNNPTIFPISCIKLYVVYNNVYSDQRYCKTICVPLDYRTKTSVIIHIVSQYAGNLDITLEKIRIYDYMKLFSLKRKMNSEIMIAVLPSYYELENYDILNRNTKIQESEIYSQLRSGDDPSEVFAIRQYREGDRLQRIHWKLSRKQNQLMIKEFSDPVNCSALLFVNLNIPEEVNVLFSMDAILECALSLSYSFLMKGQIHYLSWYDREHSDCRRVRIVQEKDLFEAVDGLLHARPYAEVYDEMAAYLAQYPHDRYSNLILISPKNLEQQLDSLADVKADSRQLIYIRNRYNQSDRALSPELLQKYRETGIDVCPVNMNNIRKEMEQRVYCITDN